MPNSVREVFDEIPNHFNADAWGSQNAVLQFNITGDEGGTWTAKIENGNLTVSEGAANGPDMTVTTSDKDMVAMVNGELNAVSAFMQGRVRIDGDMSLAMKLQNLLSR